MSVIILVSKSKIIDLWCFYFLFSNCSRKRFSEKEAEQWWALNRARVYQQYNIPMVDKASVGMGREGLTH